MRVEIRPIEKKKWHGKTGKDSFTRPRKIQALVDTDTMQYATGLTEEDLARLEKNKVKYDLSPQFNPDSPHPFWDSPTAAVKLENSTIFLDTKKDLDLIKFRILQKSRFVANSVKAYEDGEFQEATHVIFDENEDIKAKATKVQVKNTAIIEAAKLDKEKKANIILILDGKFLRDKSANVIDVALDKLIEKDPASVLRQIQLSAEEVTLHAVILEAVHKGVLRKDGHKFLYHDAILGHDIYDVIKYLSDDMNQELKFKIIKTINE